MINFCQFGAGRIGNVHADAISANENANLKYVVDVNGDAAQALASRHGASVSSVGEALADPDIRAVIVASSTDTHADLIEQSVKAGKAVFCEKPVDLSLERVNDCVGIVNAHNQPVFIGFNRRFDASFAKLKSELDDGAIGKLEMIAITSRDPSPPPLEYVKVSGGLFRDMMIHDFDMAHWLLGEVPVEVFAYGSSLVDPEIGKLGDVDTAAVTLKTKSGVLCQISNSRRAVYGYDQRVEVFGSGGMLQAGNRSETSVVKSNADSVQSDKPLLFFLERYADAYGAELTHFIDCINNAVTPSVTIEDGKVALQLAEAAIESLNSGRPVGL